MHMHTYTFLAPVPTSTAIPGRAAHLRLRTHLTSLCLCSCLCFVLDPSIPIHLPTDLALAAWPAADQTDGALAHSTVAQSSLLDLTSLTRLEHSSQSIAHMLDEEKSCRAHQARHTHARLHINMPDSLLSYRIVLVDIAFIQAGGGGNNDGGSCAVSSYAYADAGGSIVVVGGTGYGRRRVPETMQDGKTDDCLVDWFVRA